MNGSSPLAIQPGRLWGLWEMLEITAKPFLGAVTWLAATSQFLATMGDTARPTMMREQFADLEKSAREFHDICLEIGLGMCAASALRAIETFRAIDEKSQGAEVVTIEIPEKFLLHASLSEISNRLKDEFSTRILLTIPIEKTVLYSQPDPLFGSEFSAKFPSANYDLDEAGKCIALGRSTAAVFHLMRVMEFGLQSVHACLGITVSLTGNDRNWGNILRRIRDNIDGRVKSAEKDFFQEIYALLNSVKDAWRNATMHIENKYTEEEAAHIFTMIKGFMKKIAARMDETGRPVA